MRHKVKLFCLLSILFSIVCTTPSHAQSQTNLLPVDQAFAFQFTLSDKQTLEFYWEIAPEYYLYKDHLSILNADNKELITPEVLPKGTKIDDPVLGEIIVYSNKLQIKLPWKEDYRGNSILVKYQGCAESGFCFAPVNKQIHINSNLQTEVLDTDLEEFPSAEAMASDESATASQVEKIADNIKERYLPLTMLIFFGFGILLAFSPCVLPMLPLVVNLIIGGKKIKTRKAFILSGSYVIGMAGTYAIAGTIAGSLGATFQAAMQQPAILIVFSLALVVFALTQFELIHIKIPSFNHRLHHWGQKQIQGSVPGAFVLGIISSLLVSPCITPPLIGVLTYIGQNGNPFVGAVTLFCLGLGMGVPLMIIAVLSGVLIPAAGPWMNLIRTISGLALLGLAIWIISRVIPAEISLILWGTLCFIATYYLFKAHMVFKIIGACLAIYGAVLVVMGFNINFDFLSGIYSKKAAAIETLHWHDIDTMHELTEHINEAKSKQQLVILEVSANWCTSCKRIERGVFTNQDVQDLMQKFMLLKLDVTKVTPDIDAILKRYKIFGPPEILFFDAQGEEVKAKRLVGNVSLEDMLHTLQSFKQKN